MDDIPVAPIHGQPRMRPAEPSSPTSKPGHAPVPDSSRRGFFYNLFTALVAGMVGVVPMAAGLAVYLDPLRRKSALAGPRPVATINPADFLSTAKDGKLAAAQSDVLIGRFSIIADRVDAWNIYKEEPIGGVYLIIPQGTTEVKALHATCPHLGCSVDLQEKGGGEFAFKCPCHTSAFTSEGKRIMPCVSPRDMDDLACLRKVVPNKPEATGDGDSAASKKGAGELWEISVDFKNYQPGLAEQKVKS